MRKLLCTSFLMLFLSFQLFAQDRQISGTVTDGVEKVPLPGVSILIKGTNSGTSTDAEGRYRINVPSGSQVLVFSFVGFATQEVEIGNRTTIDVTLMPDTKTLQEVVVTGYGQQIKREVTGNIAKVGGSDIKDMPVPTFDNAIQGKAAGVVVNAGGGKLGQGIQIRVRGQSSVSASNEPLYVIDGIPVTTADLGSFGGATNPLADINPQDIESIEILKDASSAAIFGSRAANGVVLVTTKRGKAGRTNINFGVQIGNSKPTRRVRFLNAQEYRDFYLMAAANSDRIDGIPVNDPDSYTTYIKDFFEFNSLGVDADTDWGALAFQHAPLSQYDLNMNGGNEKTSFYVSGQLLDQKGILVGNGLQRISGRINLEHRMSNKFTLGANMGLTRTLNNRISGDRQFDNPMQIVALPPITPQIDPKTNLPVGMPPGDISLPLYYNPLINIGNAYYNTTVYRNISTIFGQLEILKGLFFRSEFGVDILNQQEELYYNSKTQRNFGAPLGLGQNLYTRVENYNTNNFFTWDKAFGEHGLTVVGGMSYQQSQQKNNFIEGRDFPSDAYRMIVSAARKTDGSSSETNFRFLSYFLRANYKFKERYLLGLSARIDGSSRFGNESKYGFFPAASAGWIISEENFLKNNDVISFLKLRASFGRTGNAEIGNFPARGLFAGAGYAGNPGQAPTQLGNPNLSWETTDQWDVGIDFGVLNNRISGELDYYQKNTTGLLLNVNVPGTTGFTTQVRNVGAMSNKGVEIVINTDNLTGEFKWKTSFNAARNFNKVTNLDGQIIEAGLNNMSRAVEGQPLGVFFTAEYAGVNPENGDALWYRNRILPDGSLDRSTTNRYNEAQRVVVGSPLPKWTGGITNTFSYKGFDLSIFFNAQLGQKINFYGVGRFSSANGRFEDNQTADQLNAWTPQNRNTDIPEARLFFNNGAQPSSRFIYDGSFVRLRNVTLSYNLPKNYINKLSMTSARIFVSAQNFATFTKYKGWDPEVNADDIVSNIAQGYDFYTAPQPRTITFGVNVSF
ncbi:MAG: TonB-dependent receptor [Cytophagales bacterium]|nr:TonB-dependent receptor [Bernardetiaceae bacterium]MDW8205494.1 TonB-dependent receptor [Cytophagales bacterium]